MLSGQQVDHYFIQELIARGGMAEVYLASDANLQRQIALKVLLPELTTDKTAVAHFSREARQVDANWEDGLNHWAPDVFQITFSPGNFQNLPPSAFRWQGNEDNQAMAVSADNIQLQAQPTTTGYNLEAAIPWLALNITPARGVQIGLALNATDNDTPDTAVQEIFMSNVSTRRLLDPTSWGSLTLQESERP